MPRRSGPRKRSRRCWRTGEGPRVSGQAGVWRRGAGGVHRTGRARWQSLPALLGTGRGRRARRYGDRDQGSGFVEANPATGQLTTKFLENPQTPFSELKIHLNGGPRAPIDNPATCGPAVTTARLYAVERARDHPGRLVGARGWRRDAVVVLRRGGLRGRAGPGAGFCGGDGHAAGRRVQRVHDEPLPPRPRTVRQGHPDPHPAGAAGDALKRRALRWTAGRRGNCPESSKIGTTRVASGAGSHPFEIEGTVYLTGPHDGAPFGLSIVTHAVAGPYNLGLVVVRARIDVDPTDSTLTVTTDETGPYALPQIIFGVPLRLQRITVDIDRPGFMFNPTDCGAAADPAAARSPVASRRSRVSQARSRSGAARVWSSNRSSRSRRVGGPVERVGRASTRSCPTPRVGRQRGEHREGQSRTPQTAPVAVDDVAESVRCGAV